MWERNANHFEKKLKRKERKRKKNKSLKKQKAATKRKKRRVKQCENKRNIQPRLQKFQEKVILK